MYLIIVESPAKAGKIQKYLDDEFGKGLYNVKASYGHIRSLEVSPNTINVNNWEIKFVNDKHKVIKELKTLSRGKEVILASDEDREGEAIAWHLQEVLKLKEPKRIVFHEITKKAIVDAIKSPTHINMNMVNSQLARQILDFIIGIGATDSRNNKYPGLSPLLWNNIKGPRGLSAGRVQSPVIKLVYELEQKIKNTKTSDFYKIEGKFNKIQANINKNFDEKTGISILEKSIESIFTISDIIHKKMERKPSPPYITSTLQQDASKVGMSTKMIMSAAQKLYENGLITYHRTDSFNLSNEFIEKVLVFVEDKFGKDYISSRKYHSKGGAQEAHEAIRPTNVNRIEVKNEWNKVYQLIWKRAVASQMSNQVVNSIDVNIKSNKYSEIYHSILIEELFPGYKILYGIDKTNQTLLTFYKSLKKGMKLKYNKINAIQTNSTKPDLFTESTLVRALEKEGFGRPSTYASIISKVQDKGYILKNNIIGKKVDRLNYYIDNKTTEINKEIKKYKELDKKNRLICSDLGINIAVFLDKHFNNNVMNYKYTAEMEKGLDLIANGELKKNDFLTKCFKEFNSINSKLQMNKSSSDIDKGRFIGNHPISKEPIYVRVAKYGPVAQIGEYKKGTKLRYINIDKNKNLDEVTLEYILSKQPRIVGKYHDCDIILKEARYGWCLYCEGKYYSLNDDEKENIDKITEENAISIIRRIKKSKKPLKTLLKGKAVIKEGPYGVYLNYNGKNISIPKHMSMEDVNDDFVLKLIKKIES